MKEDSVSPYPVLSGRLNYRRHGLDSELVRLSDQPQHLLQNRHQCAVHGNDVVPDYDVISGGRLVSGKTSVRYRFGFPFVSKVVVCGHCLVTLSLTINETVKQLSSPPTLMQVILVVTV